MFTSISFSRKRVHGIQVSSDIVDLGKGPHLMLEYLERVFGDQFGDLFVGIIYISEDSRPGRTDLNAGRLQARGDPVMAEITLLDNGDKRVDIPRIVRARGQAVFTADTAMLINYDDPVFLFPGGLDRAIDHAGGVVALITESGKKMASDVRVSSLLNDLYPGAKHPKGNPVFRFTGYGAAVTTDASPKINGHCVSFFVLCLFHDF